MKSSTFLCLLFSIIYFFFGLIGVILFGFLLGFPRVRVWVWVPSFWVFFSEIWSHILERYPCAFITRFFPSSISCFTHHHVLASIRSFITVSKHALCLVFRLWLHIHILGLLHSNHRRLGTASIVIVRRISSHGALLRAIARQPRIPHHRPKL